MAALFIAAQPAGIGQCTLLSGRRPSVGVRALLLVLLLPVAYCDVVDHSFPDTFSMAQVFGGDGPSLGSSGSNDREKIYDTGRGVAVAKATGDADAHLFVVGTIEGSSGDVKPPNFEGDYKGGRDIFLSKHTLDGSIVKGILAGGPGNDHGLGIATNENSVYICGFVDCGLQSATTASLSFGNADLSLTLEDGGTEVSDQPSADGPSVDQQDGFVAHFQMSDLSFTKLSIFGGKGKKDSVTSIVFVDNFLFVGGHFDYTLTIGANLPSSDRLYLRGLEQNAQTRTQTLYSSTGLGGAGK
jgi:hypothetical protein